MKYSKEQVNNMIKQMHKDRKKPYFDQMPFKLVFAKNIYVFETKKNHWTIFGYFSFVQEDQFPDKDEYAIIHIVMNDETGDIETYSDTSCGRPVPQKAKLKNGKYEFEIIQ